MQILRTDEKKKNHLPLHRSSNSHSNFIDFKFLKIHFANTDSHRYKTAEQKKKRKNCPLLDLRIEIQRFSAQNNLK